MQAWAPLLVSLLLAAPVATAQPLPVEDQVAASLAAEVRARLGAAASVTVDRVQVAVRAGASGPVAVVLPQQTRLGGPLGFSIIGAGTSGRPAQVGRGTARVVVRVPHAQASRLLVRGTVITEADVVDVVGEPGAVPLRRLPTVRELVGATTRTDVAQGAVMTPQSAVLPPAVRAGEPVQAVALVGAVQVTAELTAMDNGAEGAIVRVVNRESRREFRARVVRTGIVEVIHD